MVKILFVDDDQLICKTYKLIFQAKGFAIETSLTGEDAWDKLQKEKYNFLIIDLLLPGLSGVDLIKMIKNDESLKDIPLVVLTALIQNQACQEAKSAGAQACYLKDKHEPKDLVDELIRKFPLLQPGGQTNTNP